MQIPQGYEHNIINITLAFVVCKHNKSIHVHEYDSRSWFTKFSSTLLSHDYKQSKFDSFKFTKGTNSNFIYVNVIIINDVIVGYEVRSN